MRDAKQIFDLYGINVIGKDILTEAPKKPQTPLTDKDIRRYSRKDVKVSAEKLDAVVEKAGSLNKIERALGIKHHGYMSKVVASKRIQMDAVEIIKELWGIDISES